jgi:hypothetical protein
MITVIKELGDDNLQQQVLARVEESRQEVARILPDVPEDLQIYFDQGCIMPETGTGGFAYSRDIITIGFDIDYSGDRKAQLKDIRPTIFHESYHQVQGYVHEDGKTPEPLPIEHAIYEGAATVFERDCAGSSPPYAQYEDDAIMWQWAKELAHLSRDYDYRKWKFYDPETKRKWIVYKTGVFLVDQYLATSPTKDIIGLSTVPAQEVLGAMRDKV